MVNIWVVSLRLVGRLVEVVPQLGPGGLNHRFSLDDLSTWLRVRTSAELCAFPEADLA